MKKKEALLIASFIIAASAFQVKASILYKKYVVAAYNGAEILCEPYLVRKDDSVIKLLRQKGDISAQDFPEFLRMFQSLNPRITDINLIRQNDEIFIPLKKLTPNSMPGQSSGVVSIPFVSLTSFGEVLKAHTEEYSIKEGDNISGIVDRSFQPNSPEEEKRGTELLKLLNPDIKSLDQIKAGSSLVIPKKSIKSQPWYKSMYDSKGKIHPENAAIQQAGEQPGLKGPGQEPAAPAAMEKLASVMGGKLYKSGQYFIPMQSGKAHKIDLSKDPILDVEGGGKVLFCSDYDSLTETEKSAIKQTLPDTSVVDTKKADSVEGIINSLASASVLRKPAAPVILNSENALIEIMPEWLFAPGRVNTDKKIFLTPVSQGSKKTHSFLIDYLKHTKGVLLKEMGENPKDAKPDQKDYFTDETEIVNFSRQTQLYANLSIAMGYNFSADAEHSIATDDGAYIDLNADTIYAPGGQIFIMADKELSDDKISSLRSAGFKVLEFPDQNEDETDYSESTICSFLEMLGCKTEINPTLNILSNRSGQPYVTIKPKGIHAKTPNNTEFIITKGNFSSPIIASLQQAGIKPVRLVFNSFY